MSECGKSISIYLILKKKNVFFIIKQVTVVSQDVKLKKAVQS